MAAVARSALGTEDTGFNQTLSLNWEKKTRTQDIGNGCERLKMLITCRESRVTSQEVGAGGVDEGWRSGKVVSRNGGASQGP